MKIYDGTGTSAPLIGTYCGNNSPGVVSATNSEGALTVVFYSDVSVTGTGWEADIITECFPFIIAAGEGRSLCFIGDSIQLGSDTTYTGYEYSWTSIPQENINNVQNPVVTPSVTTTYILTATDTSTGCNSVSDSVIISIPDENDEYLISNGNGIEICTGKLFDSGGSTDSYSYNETYTYTITPCDANKHVQIDFTLMDIEYHATCDYDNLKIYDGINTAAPLIGKYCGSIAPGAITASNPEGALTLVFTSDLYVTGDGFEAAVSCLCNAPVVDAGIEKGICPGNTVSIGGNPTASGGSGEYSYYWAPQGTLNDNTLSNPVVSTTTTETYYLTVTDNEGCSASDSVTVLVNNSSTDEYIGNQNAEYQVSEGRFYDSGGSTGDYNYYEDYLISFYPCTEGGKISMDFLNNIDVEAAGCVFDYLTIYDGPDSTFNELGTYCGTDSIGLLMSSHETGALSVHFHSDYSITGAGWEAVVKEILPFELEAEVVNIDDQHSYGSIFLSVSGGIEPYTYNWSTGDTIAEIDSLSAGVYSVTVTDAIGSEITNNYEVLELYNILWTDVVGIDFRGKRVVCNTNGYGNSGAASENILKAGEDGTLRYEVTSETLHEYHIGLSYENLGLPPSEIDYAFRINTKGLMVVEKNIVYHETLKFYSIGDVFTIKRIGAQIKFYYNEELLKELPVDINKDMIVDISFSEEGEYIEKIWASFSSTTCTKLQYNSGTITISDNIYSVINWEYSLTGQSFSIIPGAIYNTHTPIDNGYYRAKVMSNADTCYSEEYFFNNGSVYYVNDKNTVGDKYCTSPGSSSNNGLSPDSPLREISEVFDLYDLYSGDSILLDSGLYAPFEIRDIQVDKGAVPIKIKGVKGKSTIDVSEGVGIGVTECRGLIIEGLSITGDQLGGDYRCILINNSEDVVIENSLLKSYSLECILSQSLFGVNKDIQVINNQFTKKGGNSSAISIKGEHNVCKIIGNIIETEYSDDGIRIVENETGISTGVVIKSNRIIGGTGIKIEGTSKDHYLSEIIGNSISVESIEDNASGIILNHAKGVDGGSPVISYNKISGGQYGVYIQENVVAPKLMVNFFSNQQTGIMVQSESSSIGYLFNNSFYSEKECLSFSPGASMGWNIINNIMQCYGITDSSTCIKSDSLFESLDYNLYSPSPVSNNIALILNSEITTLSKWQGITGNDASSLVGDPGFINAGAGNLNLGESSPAYSSGVLITEIKKDINGLVLGGVRAIGGSGGITIYLNSIPTALLSYDLNQGWFITTGDYLKFKYNEEYSVPIVSSLNYKIYRIDEVNSNSHVIQGQTGDNSEEALVYGTNYYTFDITDYPVGFYLLEVTNIKSEKQYLKFHKGLEPFILSDDYMERLPIID